MKRFIFVFTAFLLLLIYPFSARGIDVPILSEPTVMSIDTTSALLGASIDSNGGDTITGRGTVWNTTGAPVTENQLAEGGTELGVFSHTRTGLPAGTLIYFRGFAVNSEGTGYSSGLSFYTEPATQASGVEFSDISYTSMRITWTAGDGDGTIVVVKSDSAVDTDPMDGTEYAADNIFGSGEQLGTGTYVVFSGAETQVDITGLTAGKTYYVAVYEYSGSGAGADGINYQQTAPATGSQATIIGLVSGKVFDISIYSPGSDTVVSNMSFLEDGFIQFSAYNGFGVYMALGNAFSGIYLTPEFEGNDLLMVFSGLTIGPYVSAIGVAVVEADLSNMVFLFMLGHEPG